MHLEGSKHLVGMAERRQEFTVVRIGIASAQSLDGSLVKHLEDRPPHGRFDGIGRIEVLVDGAQVLLQYLRIDSKRVRRLVVEMACAATAVIAVVKVVDYQSEFAPGVGARPKKRFKRFLSVVLSAFEGSFSLSVSSFFSFLSACSNCFCISLRRTSFSAFNWL